MNHHELAEILQLKLAEIDFLTEPPPQSRSGFIELLLLKLKDVKLKMYQEKGHAMPHVHIDYGRQHHVASFSIDSPSRIEGSLHPKYDKSIVSWISENREILLRIWNEANGGGNPDYLIAKISASN